jgi:excisionase family DNA binding protein
MKLETPDPTELYHVTEAARRFLGTDRHLVSVAIRRGELAAVRRGRKCLIIGSELERWLKARRPTTHQLAAARRVRNARGQFEGAPID